MSPKVETLGGDGAPSRATCCLPELSPQARPRRKHSTLYEGRHPFPTHTWPSPLYPAVARGNTRPANPARAPLQPLTLAPSLSNCPTSVGGNPATAGNDGQAALQSAMSALFTGDMEGHASPQSRGARWSGAAAPLARAASPTDPRPAAPPPPRTHTHILPNARSPPFRCTGKPENPPAITLPAAPDAHHLPALPSPPLPLVSIPL